MDILKASWHYSSGMNGGAIPKMLSEMGPTPLQTSPCKSLSFSFRDGFKGLKFLKDNCFSLFVFLNHLVYFLLYKLLEDIKFTWQASVKAHICQKSFVMKIFLPLVYSIVT